MSLVYMDSFGEKGIIYDNNISNLPKNTEFYTLVDVDIESIKKMTLEQVNILLNNIL